MCGLSELSPDAEGGTSKEVNKELLTGFNKNLEFQI